MSNNSLEKSKGKLLQEKLFAKRKNGILRLKDGELETIDSFCEGYKSFLDDGKTEREAAKASIELATSCGFSEYDPSKKYSPATGCIQMSGASA